MFVDFIENISGMRSWTPRLTPSKARWWWVWRPTLPTSNWLKKPRLCHLGNIAGSNSNIEIVIAQITNVVDEHWEEKEGSRCSQLGSRGLLREPRPEIWRTLNNSSTTFKKSQCVETYHGAPGRIELHWSPGARGLKMWFVHFCMKTTKPSEYHLMINCPN